MIIQVADVTIDVTCPVDFWIKDDFTEVNTEPDRILRVHGLPRTNEREPSYDGVTMDARVEGDLRWNLDIYDVRRHIGYLAGDASTNYRFCSAAGFQLHNKGVLLLGESGTGKSTLTRLLAEHVLDDDILFASEREIIRIGNVGFQVGECGKRVDLLKGEPGKLDIDYVFVLDNKRPGGYLREINPGDIGQKKTFDDRLHPSLFERYKQQRPPAFSCPIYEVGTASTPKRTRDTIADIVH